MHTVKAPQARGVMLIHSARAALCPHIEWALGAVLGSAQPLDWTNQPAERGTRRAELSFTAPAGTGALLASRLKAWENVRFEVTEEPTPGSDGMRWSYTPSLGLFSSAIGVHGDVLVHEDRIKQAVAAEALGGASIHDALHRLLGTAWDDELEIFRHAGEDAPVRWLHQVV